MRKQQQVLRNAFCFFLEEGYCWGQAVGTVNEHKILKTPVHNTDFEGDRRTVLFPNKGNIEQGLSLLLAE